MIDAIVVSGVTRVGVTRGGNWLSHPIWLTTFLVIALWKTMTFLAVVTIDREFEFYIYIYIFHS